MLLNNASCRPGHLHVSSYYCQLSVYIIHCNCMVVCEPKKDRKRLQRRREREWIHRASETKRRATKKTKKRCSEQRQALLQRSKVRWPLTLTKPTTVEVWPLGPDWVSDSRLLSQPKWKTGHWEDNQSEIETCAHKDTCELRLAPNQALHVTSY